MTPFIKLADKAADKIYNQIINIQDKINKTKNDSIKLALIDQLNDLKCQLDALESNIDTIKEIWS